MTKSSKENSPCVAVAFGRNYFHALGGATTTTATSSTSTTTAVDASAAATASAATANRRTFAAWAGLSLDDDKESQVVQVDAGAQSTAFLTSSGKVYQTGTIHGHVYSSPTRVTIPLPMPAVQVSCGRHFCLALMSGGVVVSWGAGHFGQLGIGASADGGGLDTSSSTEHHAAASLTFTATPVVVERLLPHIIGSPVVKLSAGDWHALALTQSGRVWAWGSNRTYQCGRKPSSSNTTAPTLTAPLPVSMDGAVIDIAAGRSHSVALLSPHSPGSSPSSAASPLTAGMGQVYAWGASQYGQCGILRRAGSGVVPPRLVEGLAEVTIEKISAAGNHNLALTSGGRVFGWGSSSEGELGLGVAVPAQVTPRLVGELDFCAILAGQEWKSQIKQQALSQQQTPSTTTHGAEGNDPSESSSETGSEVTSGAARPTTTSNKVLLAQVPKITNIVCGPSYSAAVSSSGHVYVWGSNDAGQLGINKPPDVPLKDSYVQGPKTTSTNRDLHVQTFDSSHNILLPTRLDAVRDVFVQQVACGPNHLWCIGNKRTREQQTMAVGKTLYEMQEEQRLQKLQRARDSLLAKLHHLGDDAGTATEGTTTQTDDNDTVVESSSPLSHPASPRFATSPLSHTGSHGSPLSEGPVSTSMPASGLVTAGSFGRTPLARTPRTAASPESETSPASHHGLPAAEPDFSTTDVDDTTHNASIGGYGLDNSLSPVSPRLSPEPEPTSSPASSGQSRARRFSFPWRRFSFGSRSSASLSRSNRALAADAPTSPTTTSPPSNSTGGSFRRRRSSRPTS